MKICFSLSGLLLLSTLLLPVASYANKHIERYEDLSSDPIYNCASEHKRQEPKEALIYLHDGLEQAQAIKDTLACAFWKNHIGSIYIRLGYYDLALQYVAEALLVFEDHQVEEGIQLASRNLGMAYHFTGEYEKALPYYQSFLEHRLKENPPGKIKHRAYAYVAHIYRLTGRYEEALNAYRMALMERSNVGISGDIGKTYLAMKNYRQAKKWIFKSLKLREGLNKYYAISSSCVDLAQLYLETNDLDSCLFYVEKGVSIAQIQHSRDHLKELFCTAAEAAYQLNDLDQYHHYTGLCQAYNDSLLGMATQAKIAEYQTLFETFKKENEIHLLTQGNEIKQLKIDRQTWLLVLLLIAGFTLALFLLLIFQNYRNRQVTKSISLEQKLLRTQMNPHFIHNSLMAIQGFVYKDDPAATSKHLSGFAQLTRHILQCSNEDLIPLTAEIAFLKQYVSLQQLRFNDSFSVDFILSANLQADQWRVPPMLTQPFIENAIEHGIKTLAINGKIIIRFERLTDELVITVADNGVGINQTTAGTVKQANRKSMATAITKERLALINRKWKRPVLFAITDLQNEEETTTGTQVTFNIPAIPMSQSNNQMKAVG